MTRVTLTLPPEVAERLRATCHARGKTASDLVAEWLKCDAEGVEAEVLEHYRTLADCLAVVYEFHTPRLRTRCRELMRERTKMRLVRAENVATYGTDIWVP